MIRCLLVDDDEDLRRTIVECLGRFGVQATPGGLYRRPIEGVGCRRGANREPVHGADTRGRQ
jgi:hypothetical protein